MPYRPGCGHSWEAVPGHELRLKCQWCGAIGYMRQGPPGSRPSGRIYVYICGVMGCQQSAVKLDPPRCKVHAK